MPSFLSSISDPNTVITPIDSSLRFPEILDELERKYRDDITTFAAMVAASETSAALLVKIRSPEVPADRRMSLLKMFRRCVSPILDTETTKKITALQELVWVKTRV